MVIKHENFIENKYFKWYCNIINNALLRKLDKGVYCESHHIIPRSMGGGNKKTNLVNLTGKEHYVVHHLLTKFTNNSSYHKMMKAYFMMANLGKGFINARQFEILKTYISNSMKKVKPLKTGLRSIYHPETQAFAMKKSEELETHLEAGWILKSSCKPRPTNIVCEHCSYISNPGNHAKHHGDKCRSLLPEEPKRAYFSIRKICEHCQGEFNIGHYVQRHGDNCKVINPDIKFPNLGNNFNKRLTCKFCLKTSTASNIKQHHGIFCEMNPNKQEKIIKPRPQKQCDFCDEINISSVINSRHNKYCKQNPDRTPFKTKDIDTCIHCSFSSVKGAITRYHNDNCKHKSQDNSKDYFQRMLQNSETQSS